MKVLSLDDDSEFCDYLESLFDATDLEFVKVHTINEAKDVIDKNNFEIILLDLNLPDGSGLEIAREIRKNSKQQPILALITSSMISSHEYLEIKKEFKINFILSKSYFSELAHHFIIQLQESIPKEYTHRS